MKQGGNGGFRIPGIPTRSPGNLPDPTGFPGKEETVDLQDSESHKSPGNPAGILGIHSESWESI